MTGVFEIIAIILAGFIVLAIGWFILPFGLRRLSEARLARLCREHKAIVLSYDDGPGPGLTQGLLALLEGRGVATFFVLGRSVQVNGDTVSQMLAAGHEVGSHSFHHSNAWKVGPLRASRDLAAGISAVRAAGGNATLFRPPYGKLTLAGLLDGAWRKQRFGWWTIDSKDTKPSRARRPIDDIIGDIDRQGGGVVLMHDFDQDPNKDGGRSHADYVLDLTSQIIDFSNKNGYRLMRLSDVLRLKQDGVLVKSPADAQRRQEGIKG